MSPELQSYVNIALKLITGMLGILVFLRITGKAQMAQLTPLDTVTFCLHWLYGPPLTCLSALLCDGPVCAI